MSKESDSGEIALDQKLTQWMIPAEESVLVPKKTKPEEPEKEEMEIELLMPVLSLSSPNPLAATLEAPTNPRYFSSANTLAATVEELASKDSDPQIDGARPDALLATPVVEPSPIVGLGNPKSRQKKSGPPLVPLTPSEEGREAEPVEKKAVVPEPAVDPQPLGGRSLGDLALAQPVPNALVERVQTERVLREERLEQKPAVGIENPVKPSEKRRRPASLAEARAGRGAAPADAKKQEGGSPRRHIVAAMDVKMAFSGEYQNRMIYAIQHRWFSLLDESRYAMEGAGKVEVRFLLHSDGSVSDVKTTHNDTSEILAFVCESAIIEPSLYGRWPTDMREFVGKDSVPITFTFFY